MVDCRAISLETTIDFRLRSNLCISRVFQKKNAHSFALDKFSTARRKITFLYQNALQTLLYGLNAKYMLVNIFFGQSRDV